MESNPFFTVVMPAFNRAHVIHKAIDSLCSQSFINFELIVVDDGSTDNTSIVVQQYADQRIKLIRQQNAGVCAARNAGIVAARGEWVSFLDTDDSVMENWLSDFYEAVITNRYDVVICRRTLVSNPDVAKHSFLAGTFVVSAPLLKMLGGYDERIQFGENTELRWRLEQQGARFGMVNGVNMIYDDVSGEGSVNFSKKVNSFFYLSEKHKAMFNRHPKIAQQYWQVAGVDSFRLGELRQCRKLLWQGYGKFPLNVKALARAVWYSVKTWMA